MFLRTTTTAASTSMLNYIFANQSKYNELSEQVASGKKLLKPSDNASDAISVLNINKELSKLSGYTSSIKLACNELDVVDNNMALITKNLQRANDLAVQASNGTYNTKDLAGVKIEIDQIIENLIDIGNTKFNNAYIFSGTNTGTPPFDRLATGGVGYEGTPQTGDYQRQVSISEGVSATINVTGDKLLGSYDEASGTGEGIMKTLYDLSAALGNPDATYDGIRDSLDKIQDGINNVSTIRTTLAGTTKRLEMTESSIETNVLQLKSYRSNLEDVDIAEAVTNLSTQELALKATMAVASKTMQISLLDYL